MQREAAFSWKRLLWFPCTLFSHSTTSGTRPDKNGDKEKNKITASEEQPHKISEALRLHFYPKGNKDQSWAQVWSALRHWSYSLYFCGLGAAQVSMLWTRAQECFGGQPVPATSSHRLGARCRSLQPAEFSSSLCTHKCPPGPPTAPSNQQLLYSMRVFYDSMTLTPPMS